MSNNFCPNCGTAINQDAVFCQSCGEKISSVQPPVIVYANQSGISPLWPIKNKIAAGLLGIFLGGFGIHKFYLGKIGMGIVYLLFCWTYLPAIIGFIEGIIYLCSSDENFQLNHHVRLN